MIRCRRRFRRLLAVLLAASGAGIAVAAPLERQGEAAGPGGKPVAPIAMRYALAGEPALGRPLTVTVTIVPTGRLDNAFVAIDAAQGLTLNAGPGRLAYPSLDAGEPIDVVIDVTPLALATLRLNVTVSGDMHGDAQARTLSIPLRLGPVLKTPATLKVDASGQILHSLPAGRPPRGNLR